MAYSTYTPCQPASPSCGVDGVHAQKTCTRIRTRMNRQPHRQRQAHRHTGRQRARQFASCSFVHSTIHSLMHSLISVQTLSANSDHSHKSSLWLPLLLNLFLFSQLPPCLAQIPGGASRSGSASPRSRGGSPGSRSFEAFAAEDAESL